MTMNQIYNLAVEMAKKVDPRGSDLPKNPYPDSAILHTTNPSKTSLTVSEFKSLRASKHKSIKTILAGIDMDSAEILLAHFLKVDLAISHHPQGKALADLGKAIPLQADLMHSQIGVPINIAEGVLKKRIAEVKRQIAPINHYQTIDMSKHSEVNFMCLHTVCDNLAWNFVENKLKNLDPRKLPPTGKTIPGRQKPTIVKDVVNLLLTIPEYQEAKNRGAGPTIIAGSPQNRAGRVATTEFTGGTDGGKLIYPALANAGLGTIISMHMKEESREEAEKNHINVVCAGHIASDSLGMNLFLDELEKKGIEVIPTSGLIRVKRN